MDLREAGLTEIFERIKEKRVVLGLKSFKRTPTRPSEASDMPCVFMLEGIDTVVKKSTRTPLGYPKIRNMEVVIELVVNKRQTPDIKELCDDLKKAVFTVRNTTPEEYSAILTNEVYLQENRMEGPIGYGLPDIKVMRVIFDLIYIEGGF